MIQYGSSKMVMASPYFATMMRCGDAEGDTPPPPSEPGDPVVTPAKDKKPPVDGEGDSEAGGVEAPQ